MTLAIVDPLGQYNTDHGTSWVAHDSGGKCVYLPSAGEFWFLLETNQTSPSFPFTTGVAANSKWLRINESTGAYIAMAADSTAQPGKLFLWSACVADEVHQLVIAAGNYFTTVGGTTIAGNCLIAWRYDGTIAWETFWATGGAFPVYNAVFHIIDNPALGALYCTRRSINPTTQILSINLTTGSLTVLTTFWDVTGSYRPMMDNNGDIWVGTGASPTNMDRYRPSTNTWTTIENVGGIIGRIMYDEAADRVHWYVNGADDVRYWNGSSVVNNTSPPSDTYLSSPGGSGNSSNVYHQYASYTGYWTATREVGLPRDLYFKDLATFVAVKQVTEPADNYAADYAAGRLKYQFVTSYTRAWWRIKQTTWKFLVWTDATTRRRVSVCVIT